MNGRLYDYAEVVFQTLSHNVSINQSNLLRGDKKNSNTNIIFEWRAVYLEKNKTYLSDPAAKFFEQKFLAYIGNNGYEKVVLLANRTDSSYTFEYDIDGKSHFRTYTFQKIFNNKTKQIIKDAKKIKKKPKITRTNYSSKLRSTRYFILQTRKVIYRSNDK